MSSFRRRVPYLVMFWVVISMFQYSSFVNSPGSAPQQQVLALWAIRDVLAALAIGFAFFMLDSRQGRDGFDEEEKVAQPKQGAAELVKRRPRVEPDSLEAGVVKPPSFDHEG